MEWIDLVVVTDSRGGVKQTHAVAQDGPESELLQATFEECCADQDDEGWTALSSSTRDAIFRDGHWITDDGDRITVLVSVAVRAD